MHNFTSFFARVLANLLLSLLGLTFISSWFPHNFQAQTSGQVEQGTDCNWPFNDVATNPVDGKVYGFWRKGSGTTAVYKLIRWNSGSWSTVGTFTPTGGAGPAVPNFESASDDVGIAIDAVGHFHVTFRGERNAGQCCNSTRGVWYGYSADGSNWTFTEIQTVSNPNGWLNTDDPVIEVDANNRPHIGFLYTDANNTPRVQTLRYYRYNGSSWIGEDAFSQTTTIAQGVATNEIPTFDLAIDGTGKAHIAFQRETNGQGRNGGLWYTTNSSGSWSTPIELAAGIQDQEQGQTISIDTDVNNKVHIVHSDYESRVYYLTNQSGQFTGGQINGNLTGNTVPHGFRINSKGDKFIALNEQNATFDNKLKYAYQLNGGSGPNGWTVGQFSDFLPDANNYISGLLNPSDNRIMMLYDKLANPAVNCGPTNTRNLWYATTTIQGSTTPTPTFTGNPTATAVCAGQNATFTATATGATSFQWQEDDNLAFSSPTAINSGGMYNVSTSGTTSTLTVTTNLSVNGRYYRLVATNSGGSVNSNSAQLTVNALPTPAITGLSSAYCKDATAVTLSGTPAGGSFTIDSQSATQLNPANLNVGNRTVRYTVSVNGCTAFTEQSVEIKALPTPAITGLGSAYCKDATAVTLSGTPAGGSFTIDGQSATQLNPANLNVGNRTVRYTVSVNGCTAFTEQTVTINALPTPNLSNNGPLADNNSTVTLTSTGGATYNFSSGATQQGGAAGAMATVTQPGPYQVTAISAQGCSATASTIVTGGSNPAPACRNGSMVISVVATGTPVKYEWYRNSITSARLVENPAQVRGTSTASLTLVNQQVSANYYVRVTDANGTAVVYGPIKATVDISCNVYGRLSAEEVPLNITLLGNPLVGEQLRATVSGAAGKTLHVQLLDLTGKPVRQQQWQQADSDQSVDWQLSDQPSGIYLLQANTEAYSTSPAQRHSLKVIKQ